MERIAGSLLVVAIAGCGGGGGPSSADPKGTVSSFFEAMKRGAAGKADGMACFTQKAREAIEKMEKRAEEMGKKAREKDEGSMFSEEDLIASYSIGDPKVEKDAAAVPVKVTTNEDGRQKTEDMVLTLRKEGAHWKIFKMGTAAFQIDYEEMGEKMEEMFKAFEKMAPGESLGTDVSEPAPEAAKALKDVMDRIGAQAKEKSDFDPAKAQEAWKKALEGMQKGLPEAPEGLK